MKQTLEQLSQITSNMSEVIGNIIKHGLDKEILFDDFKKQKQLHYNVLLKNSLRELVKIGAHIDTKVKDYHDLVHLQELINMLIVSKSKSNERDVLEIIKELKKTLPKVRAKEIDIELVGIPISIKSEVLADVDEAQVCLSAGCYRSCTILCGRILEVCLHRKYYELTKKDILETSPGLGLGKLIAKLKEQEIEFDPGLTEQIHLINKVRIDSVHKKQKPFTPSKGQAQAMLLYTADVINRLF